MTEAVPSEAEAAVAVRVRRLPHGHGLDLPDTQPGCGRDGCALGRARQLAPGARHAVSTGFAVAIPPGYEIQVRPRSGLALKHGISVPNTPGTIDSDYRGELKVILINHGVEPFAIARGERIAQLVLAPVTLAEWDEVDELDETVAARRLRVDWGPTRSWSERPPSVWTGEKGGPQRARLSKGVDNLAQSSALHRLVFRRDRDAHRLSRVAGEVGEHRLDQVGHEVLQVVRGRDRLRLAFEQPLAVHRAVDLQVDAAGVDRVAETSMPRTATDRSSRSPTGR